MYKINNWNVRTFKEIKVFSFQIQKWSFGGAICFSFWFFWSQLCQIFWFSSIISFAAYLVTHYWFFSSLLLFWFLFMVLGSLHILPLPFQFLSKWSFAFAFLLFFFSFPQGLQEGWYDGGSIAFAVLLVIFVTGMIYCSLLFFLF